MASALGRAPAAALLDDLYADPLASIVAQLPAKG